MINRLIPSSSGRILINGEDTSGQDTVTLRRNIGYVIQQIGLFPNMTIEENITVVPRMLGWDKKRCRERATELMSMVALDPTKFLHRYPREMSGGQQQRIGVIRALAADPPVLLMDEPFGAVDPINREVIQNEFLEMQRQLKKTVMLVSHDIDEALKLGDRIAVFGQGKIVQCASPDELLAKPANDFVGSFVGQDRTLKRLLLVQAGDVTDQQPTITVQRNTPLQDAFATMDDNDMRSVTVVDEDGKPLGFVKRREARGSTGRCEEMLHTFKVTGKAEENLRVVLSKLYEHNTVWMPIVDEEGRYSGEISQDYIADYLSSGRTRRRLNP
jgi:osmoprotectant transport system ATP-binding protein